MSVEPPDRFADGFLIKLETELHKGPLSGEVRLREVLILKTQAVD